MIYIDIEHNAFAVHYEPSLQSLCVNELALRLNRQEPVFDLSHEMEIHDAAHLVFATVDVPGGGRQARALCFDTHAIVEIEVTTL